MKDIAPALLAWYEVNKRPLPWREDPTPYRVWISEIMLQQTRIEAARGYFERFMTALPDVYALAAADEDTVLKLWEGLGYYSRARNLRRAAKCIVSEYGGEFPETAAKLMKLPGIGAYTAGAIASIAFGHAAPAVDGNVLRVHARLTRSAADIGEARLRDAVAKELLSIWPEGHSADFTSALMELGETVCVPGSPACMLCPLSALCEAHAAGEERLYPVMPAKKPRRVEEKNILLYLRGDRAAVCKRPEKGLLAGLWGFPEGAVPPDAEQVCEAVHIFTHVEWHMKGWLCRESEPPEGCVFVTADERAALAVPTAYRAFVRVLENMGY